MIGSSLYIRTTGLQVVQNIKIQRTEYFQKFYLQEQTTNSKDNNKRCNIMVEPLKAFITSISTSFITSISTCTIWQVLLRPYLDQPVRVVLDAQ